MSRLDTLEDSFLGVMATLRGEARIHVPLIVGEIWILVCLNVILLPLVSPDLIKALFENLLDVEVICGQFFVLKQDTLGLSLLSGKSVSETSDHLIALINLDLDECLNLVNYISRGEQVARVQQFKKE